MRAHTYNNTRTVVLVYRCQSRPGDPATPCRPRPPCRLRVKVPGGHPRIPQCVAVFLHSSKYLQPFPHPSLGCFALISAAQPLTLVLIVRLPAPRSTTLRIRSEAEDSCCKNRLGSTASAVPSTVLPAPDNSVSRHLPRSALAAVVPPGATRKRCYPTCIPAPR